MEPEPLIFNGIDGSTGQYLVPPLMARDISRIAQGEQLDPAHLQELLQRWRQVSQPYFGVRGLRGGDETNLSRSGWGVIFAHDADPAIREALAPLLDRRKAQAGAEKEKYYQEYAGVRAYRPGESKQHFLERHGAGPGPADPDKVPYYLLLVGDPEAIPFRFQYLLDVGYAVGRIHFETLEEYAHYAQNVVEAETNPPVRPWRAAFFGVRNAGDQATQLSADHLVKPLAEKLAGKLASWRFETVLGGDATKARLAQLLGGADTPAFLFSASHGMGFPNGDPRQAAHQGALLCQDWPGPIQWREPIPPEFYFAGEDLGDSTTLHGIVAFFFACYGAGTPRLDDFAHAATGAQSEIAPHGFLGELPKRLLNRGVLAVVGHVERAWGCSFLWGRAGEQLAVFESSLLRLLQGQPIGRAMEFFNLRYAELSSDLTSALEEVKYGKVADDVELSRMWTANNDARSYIIIGDPAVRLATAPSTILCEARKQSLPGTLAQVGARSGGRAERLVLHLDEDRALEMAFRLIGAGSFRMGQRGEYGDEEPEHWVKIPEGFWLGETLVTQEQYGVWDPEHENHFVGRPQHPAEQVSWNDAEGYCGWLTEACREEIPEAMVVRLPLEAEWEYGCRAETRTEYYSGDGEEALARAGWYEANAGGATHAVGEKEANGWGLRDMHGNVWEWCEDAWDNDAYKRREDGVVAEKVWGDGDAQRRVARGGSWGDSAGDCRAAVRSWFRPGDRNWVVGFRVCLVPGPFAFQTSQSEAGKRSRRAKDEHGGAALLRSGMRRKKKKPRSGPNFLKKTQPPKP